MKDDPFLRQLRSPLGAADLRPLDGECRVVQFSKPLSDDEHTAVAELLRRRPDVTLRVYGHYTSGSDLEFLRHYRFLSRFELDVFETQSLAGLRFLPDDLEHLGIGATRSRRFSLAPLARFGDLRSLRLEGQTRDLETLSELVSLRNLSLRSITLPDLSPLSSLQRLRSLELRLGGTVNLGLLPAVGELRYLEIFLVKGLVDLSAIARIRSLRFLFLQALRRVTELPRLDGLEHLERVHLETMKGLSNLAPVAMAPALKQLLLVDMSHLQVDALRPFVGHPTLAQASVGLGSLRKNDAAQRMLALPPTEIPSQLLAECYGRSHEAAF